MQPDHNEPTVEVRDLHKSFGAQVVLNGISFNVKEGDTLAVLGQSGTGKSVLLRLLIGLQAPDSGSIRIHGQDITGLDMNALNQIRKRMGFLFQQAALYDSLTVEENVAFPLVRHSKMSAEERGSRVAELLSRVGMDRDATKMPSQISGGMQKRVGLARALALDPDIVLFDEPTAGLDPITAEEIGELISGLKQQRKITSIVVTHDIHGARSFADRVVVLKSGNILTEGTFQDLEKSSEPFVVRFLHEAA